MDVHDRTGNTVDVDTAGHNDVEIFDPTEGSKLLTGLSPTV